MNAKKIGKRIRELRGEISAPELAKAIGSSVSAIFMYESGERIPRDEVKIKLARYFGVSIESLFFADQVHK